MIYIDNIHNQFSPDTIVWAIIRSNKNIPCGIQWIPDLAPSWDLFNRYIAWRSKKQWNTKCFIEEYVPQYLKELKYSDKAIQAIERLKMLTSMGRSVALVCFCQDQNLCHRSILAGVLQGMGFAVDAPDYSKYYQLLMQL